jgi:hypothetical protein
MEKRICPRAGTCCDYAPCKHSRPHIPNDNCYATTILCTYHCCEATPELLEKIEAEKIVNNY